MLVSRRHAFAVFLLCTALILMIAAWHSRTLTQQSANDRVEARIAAFLHTAQAAPNAEGAVRSFVSHQVPSSNELIVGIVDARVIRMSNAGRHFDHSLLEEAGLLDSEQATGVTDSLHWARVVVSDSSSTSATLLVAVDTSQAAAADRSRLLVGAIAALVISVIAWFALSAQDQGPGLSRVLRPGIKTNNKRESTEQQAAVE